MKLSSSLHQIGSSLISSYLVADEGGVTIVDAGLPRMYDRLEPELAAMGRSFADVRGVVLTHGDSDHIGFAERIRREHGVPIYVHRLDADRALGKMAKGSVAWRPMRIGATARFIVSFAMLGGMRIPPVKDVVTFDDAATLDLPGTPRIVPMPGHTPGSVAYHFADARALCVGDAMTTRSVLTGHPGAQPAPFTLDPTTALASVHRLAVIDVDWLLPGHGEPWTAGTAKAIEEIERFARAGRANGDEIADAGGSTVAGPGR